MMRLLVNPAAGGGRGRRLFERLRGWAGPAVATATLSRDAEDLAEQAGRAAAEGVERLLVAGGDGTFHHVLQGLAATDCVLGLIPVGRGNDLAGTLGVPRDPRAAVERALTAPPRRIDLGRVGGRWFAVYCGLGFDSEVASFVHARRRWVGGPLVYAWGVVRTLASFRPPTLEVEHDEGRFQGPATLAVLSNCPRFGGGMRIAPEARADDGLLDLVLVREVSRTELLRVFPRVYRGRHAGHPAVAFQTTRQATLAVDRPLTLFADGEPVRRAGAGETAVRAEIVPGALRVAV